MAYVNSTFTSDHKVSDLPLHPKLLQRLQQMGVNFLTDIQAACFQPMMSDSDVLMKSQTGSGKTLAYTIPLVQRMSQDWAAQPFRRDGGTRSLVIVPTRELAAQCLEVISSVARPFPHFVPGAITGGEQRHKEKARLRHGVVTLVCTPGRLVDHLRTTESFTISALQYIIYDEADRILDLGFQKDITFLLDHLKAKGARVKKSVLASATLDLRVQRLAHVTLNKPILVGYDEPSTAAADAFEGGAGQAKIDGNEELDTDITVPEELQQHYLICPSRWRLSTLAGFLRWKLDAAQPNKIIVFLSNVDSVEFHYALFSMTRISSSGEATEEERQEREALRQRRAEERRRRKRERLQAERRIMQQLEGSDGGGMLDEDHMGMITENEDEETADFAELEEGMAGRPEHGTVPLLPYNLFRLHGNVDQLERLSVYKAFGKAERGVLFCTDVAARGVDFPGVTWIVQYDSPGEERNYIHRVGRTARIGRVGNSLLFLMPHEVKYTKCLRRYKLQLQALKTEMVMFHMAQALGMDEIGGAAPLMQHALCKTVLDNPPLQRLARLGFQAYIRAYAAHPKRLKSILHPNELHLGHVATSFGLPARPSEIDSREFRKVKKEEKRAVVQGKPRRKRGNSTAAASKKTATGSEPSADQRLADYKPAILRKEEKRRLDLAMQKKDSKKRAAQLSKVSEFEAALVLPPMKKRKMGRP